MPNDTVKSPSSKPQRDAVASVLANWVAMTNDLTPVRAVERDDPAAEARAAVDRIFRNLKPSKSAP